MKCENTKNIEILNKSNFNAVTYMYNVPILSDCVARLFVCLQVLLIRKNNRICAPHLALLQQLYNFLHEQKKRITFEDH